MKANKQSSGKEAYTAPSVEIIEIENEGVIAASSGGSTGEDYNTRPMTRSASSAGSYTNAASGNDLEDLINDILTVEN